MKVDLGLYRHYRGKLYHVLMNVIHSETLENMVVYQAQYDSTKFGNRAILVRPAAMFLETVEIEGKKVPMFEHLSLMEESQHFVNLANQAYKSWTKRKKK